MELLLQEVLFCSSSSCSNGSRNNNGNSSHIFKNSITKYSNNITIFSVINNNSNNNIDDHVNNCNSDNSDSAKNDNSENKLDDDNNEKTKNDGESESDQDESGEQAKRKKYNIVYEFYIYSYPNVVDEMLIPAKNHTWQTESGTNPEVERTKQKRLSKGSIRDKRLIAIERQSGCTIRLSNLIMKESFAMPVRKVTIHAPSYGAVSFCLNIMEQLLPEYINNAKFTKPLPIEQTAWCHKGNFLVRRHRKPMRMFQRHYIMGDKPWHQRIRPERRIPPTENKSREKEMKDLTKPKTRNTVLKPPLNNYGRQCYDSIMRIFNNDKK